MRMAGGAAACVRALLFALGGLFVKRDIRGVREIEALVDVLRVVRRERWATFALCRLLLAVAACSTESSLYFNIYYLIKLWTGERKHK